MRKPRLISDFPWRLAAAACACTALALIASCAGQLPDARSSAAAGENTKVVPLLRQADPQSEAPAQTLCGAHAPTATELEKQQRVIDPLRAPAIYDDFFYGHHEDLRFAIDVDGTRYRPYKLFDDAASGLSGSVLLDAASGHALILFKGMNRPFVDSGGLGGILTDLGAVFRAKFGTANEQFVPADHAYTEALCDPRIASLELIGYSLGSQLGNFLSVKYGATGVVFGDMGLDGTLLKHYAQGDMAATRTRLKSQLTSLALSGDLLVKMFGVGDVVGERVYLPGGASGVFHQPEVYTYAANAALRDRESSGNGVGNVARSSAKAASTPAAAVAVDIEAMEASPPAAGPSSGATGGANAEAGARPATPASAVDTQSPATSAARANASPVR